MSESHPITVWEKANLSDVPSEYDPNLHPEWSEMRSVHKLVINSCVV